MIQGRKESRRRLAVDASTSREVAFVKLVNLARQDRPGESAVRIDLVESLSAALFLCELNLPAN